MYVKYDTCLCVVILSFGLDCFVASFFVDIVFMWSAESSIDVSSKKYLFSEVHTILGKTVVTDRAVVLQVN